MLGLIIITRIITLTNSITISTNQTKYIKREVRKLVIGITNPTTSIID